MAYDITDRKTFESVEKYISYLREADSKCYIVLVGTKRDLVLKSPQKRQVSIEDVLLISEKYRAAHYETSSKENYNISEVFDNIGFHCLSSQIKKSSLAPSPTPAAQSSTSSGRSCNCIIQ